MKCMRTIVENKHVDSKTIKDIEEGKNSMVSSINPQHNYIKGGLHYKNLSLGIFLSTKVFIINTPKLKNMNFKGLKF